MDLTTETKYALQGSLLEFTRVFYKLRTGRDFHLSHPDGRESHYISICRELVKASRNQNPRLIINVPPRYGKSELLIHFIAWSMAIYPDSNFLYVSYSHSLAKKQTQTIRQIMQMPHYKKIFNVHIRDDSSAKDNFETTAGGSIYAVGAGGSITGRGAGIKGLDRFGGCIAIDDIHKPDEATSDVIREGINDWYYNTLQSRLNSVETPIIFIGQRVHEDDLAANLIKTGEFNNLIIPVLDIHQNALHPEMHTRQQLLKMKDEMPYVFSAQYQQDPQPAGGGIFKPEWFFIHEREPNILATFITVDSAETDKNYNDATVFSFWGLYKIKHGDIETDLYGLHWLDCVEIRVEPKDLESEFMAFYALCSRHKIKPSMIGIENKSTGVTLLSVIKKYQGLQIINIDRTRASGSKTTRFLEAQSYVASGRVSFTGDAKHLKMCLEHCRKITANESHRFDDIADTLYDAIKLSLIDNIIISKIVSRNDYATIASNFNRVYNKVDKLRTEAYK